MFEYLKKLKPSPPETARLGDYIRKAYTKDPSIKPFPDVGRECAPPLPTLRRDRKNRIIYYIGTFNPPHQGHIALLDHVYRHSRDPDGFNAVAVIVMAHGESWVRRKVRDDAKPLQLTFDQRRRLLEDGLDNNAQTTDNMRSWLWVMPRDVNGWWAFQSKLAAACTKDGFALEFHELLGPDYVKASGPQCYAWNGVVTSNICRPADFDAGGGDPLIQLAEFQPWEQEPRRQQSAEQQQGDDGQVDGADAENEEDEAWMCYKQQKEGREEQQYSIRYIRCKQPSLDPDMSSSKLRRIIAESAPEELAENLRGLAPNPELLIQVMQENTKE
ncbi:oxidoreductase [Apiospora arundinis]